MKKKIFIFFLFLVGWFLIHTVFIVGDGLNDELGKCDVAVVLGNKVEMDGTPSKRLKSRLDKCLELYNNGSFKWIIVSGGMGKEGFHEDEVMKSYLVSKGVPEDSIIKDSEGNNTYLTAVNSKNIMEEKELQSAMVITQYYHVSRSKLALKKVGIEKVYSAHAEIFELRDVYSLIREFFACYKYIFI